MKPRLSLLKSNKYLFNKFVKEYKLSLDRHHIGEYMNHHDILKVIVYMGYADEQQNQRDIQLSKTINWLLTHGGQYPVSRQSLFKFLMIISNVLGDASEHFDKIKAITTDDTQCQSPLIPILLGYVDTNGRWHCNQQQKKSIKNIFGSLNLKRISKNDIESRHRSSKTEQPIFQPTILASSKVIAQKRIQKLNMNFSRVEDRLMRSQSLTKQKINRQINLSKEKQLIQCSFHPHINKQNNYVDENYIRQSRHLKLLQKGKQYQKRKSKLKKQYEQLNKSIQIKQCTFKPDTYKQPSSTKWVYVKNKEKEIQRLKQGRKQRQFVKVVRQRGYPSQVGWQQFMQKSKLGEQCVKPILCIDLKLLDDHHSIDVYDGQNITSLAEQISQSNKIPYQSWWKVQQLIRKSIEDCSDVLVDNNRIFMRK